MKALRSHSFFSDLIGSKLQKPKGLWSPNQFPEAGSFPGKIKEGILGSKGRAGLRPREPGRRRGGRAGGREERAGPQVPPLAAGTARGRPLQRRSSVQQAGPGGGAGAGGAGPGPCSRPPRGMRPLAGPASAFRSALECEQGVHCAP